MVIPQPDKFNHALDFQKKMRPAALKIYEAIFGNCLVEDLRESGVNVHILDKEFGIDSLIHLAGGQWVSIQEKYRRHSAIKYMDFTQEYMNAAGTKYESNGEWFKLGAQLYFYGWASQDESRFEKWALIDVAKYKMLVEQLGGLHSIGTLQQNKIHGAASFYAIPMATLEPCFVADYRRFGCVQP